MKRARHALLIDTIAWDAAPSAHCWTVGAQQVMPSQVHLEHAAATSNAAAAAADTTDLNKSSSSIPPPLLGGDGAGTAAAAAAAAAVLSIFKDLPAR